jgi:hypothetical protein
MQRQFVDNQRGQISFFKRSKTRDLRHLTQMTHIDAFYPYTTSHTLNVVAFKNTYINKMLGQMLNI